MSAVGAGYGRTGLDGKGRGRNGATLDRESEGRTGERRKELDWKGKGRLEYSPFLYSIFLSCPILFCPALL